ncbi:MAG: hypothetical protein LC749_19750, partial [Actinobacteria bacterium]|nr:hypothetical protein [Actinomycetota bacterium]
MKAGSEWARRRDLPDPCGWDDFADQPELFFDQLSARVRAGRLPISADRFTLPKAGNPTGLRILSWLDPYDEVALRVLSGRTIPAIEASRGSEIYSYPLGAEPPAWRTGRHGPAIRARRELGLTLLADKRCIGLGSLDVEDYFRSVDMRKTADGLLQLGCPIGAVEALAGILTNLAELGGPGGLPIGFEGSGVLANAVLYPLDSVLRDLVPFVRYTDDVWLFPRASGDWESQVAAATSVLETLSLRLHPQKVWLWIKPWDEPENIIRNRMLDSITAAADPKNVSADSAFELLQRQVEDEHPD